MKKLAIITVSYNGVRDTCELLASLAKVNLSKLETRIIVVDNGSVPGHLAEIKKNNPKVDVIQSGYNKGFAGGYNFGLKYAFEWGADYFWIINNDVLLPDKMVAEKLVKVLESGDDIGLVSPKIWFAPGFEFHKDRYTKKDEGKVIWYAGGKMDWNNVMVKHRGIDEVDSGKYDAVEEVDFVSGCSFMCKREVFSKVGYFDEELFAYFEDVEWMLRVAKAGYRRMYAGNTGIYHKVSRTAGIGTPFTDYLLTRNRLYVGLNLPEISLRTKFALIREAVKIVIWGREAQRKGIVDFLDGTLGGGPYVQPNEAEVEYEKEVSVISINYKTPELTEGLVKSILKKGSGWEKIKGEIIILDNASGDDIASRLKKYPDVKFIQNKENNGFAAGNNQLIRFAKGKYILLLNSDVDIKPGALNELLTEIKNKDSVLLGKLNFPDGTIQDSCFNLPSAWRAFQEYFLGMKGSYFMYHPETTKQVEGGVMACFMIPRTVLNKVGYLSEGSFMYFEDIEYCRRLKEMGVPVVFCPKAEFIHYHGMSSKKIGVIKSTEFLKLGSRFYHGEVNYALLYIVMWLGQKWGRTKSPESRWKK